MTLSVLGVVGFGDATLGDPAQDIATISARTSLRPSWPLTDSSWARWTPC